MTPLWQTMEVFANYQNGTITKKCGIKFDNIINGGRYSLDKLRRCESESRIIDLLDFIDDIKCKGGYAKTGNDCYLPCLLSDSDFVHRLIHFEYFDLDEFSIKAYYKFLKNKMQISYNLIPSEIKKSLKDIINFLIDLKNPFNCFDDDKKIIEFCDIFISQYKNLIEKVDKVIVKYEEELNK